MHVQNRASDVGENTDAKRIRLDNVGVDNMSASTAKSFNLYPIPARARRRCGFPDSFDPPPQYSNIPQEFSVPRSTYVYEPIKDDQIRLVTILPGGPDNRTLCSTSRHSLDKAPYYEDLSYSWGLPVPTMSVLVDGKELQVRPNLISALRPLERSDSL